MRILFIGSGTFALPTLRWLAQSEHELPLTVTQPARPSGRGRRELRTPVGALANQLRLQVLEAEDINAASVVDKFRTLDVRLGLMIAFGQKLGADLLNSIPGGCVNLHASLLPKYRGAAPINWAILRGEKRTGCTVFRVVGRMDGGPVLTTRGTEIKPQETAGELHARLAMIGVEAVQAALEENEGGAAPPGVQQVEEDATYAPKLAKSDGLVRFDRPAVDVANHIRGMSPWPGAAARYQAADGRSEKVNMVRARSVEGESAPAIAPGVIDERRYVAARDGFVEILEIHPSSGRVMSWADFVNGRHVTSGDSFVTPGA